ncbi:hypothetical protein [Streptomyces hygroscopicus]|uniref:hypothetical protein n=1 Tax=Streptomyces hygroscopicus TaxID=1912 RepID=UPI00117C2968|nr:hypothetical protein [Streptomyces hygroscopicus]GLV72303.1 hypothetical protein Shyhy02_03060 [Streptomyces hygroscopicus subsp. hygroscopicus]
MKTAVRKRISALFAATAIMTGGAMTIGASAASAADSIGFVHGPSSIDVYINNRIAGHTEWQANGDTLVAQDALSDGYRIEAYLGTSPVRKASTGGHTAPYTAKVGGNLPEGKKYTFWACVGKGDSSLFCSDVYTVTS